MCGQLPLRTLLTGAPLPCCRPALQRSCVLSRLEQRARARPRPAGVRHVGANEVSVGRAWGRESSCEAGMQHCHFPAKVRRGLQDWQS